MLHNPQCCLVQYTSVFIVDQMSVMVFVFSRVIIKTLIYIGICFYKLVWTQIRSTCVYQFLSYLFPELNVLEAWLYFGMDFSPLTIGTLYRVLIVFLEA